MPPAGWTDSKLQSSEDKAHRGEVISSSKLEAARHEDVSLGFHARRCTPPMRGSPAVFAGVALQKLHP